MAKLYPRLAFQNIRRDKQLYLPYLLTVLATAAGYYIVTALNRPDAWPDKTRYAYLSAFMTIGSFVIALFALIFLTYTGRFLAKRRQRELGLYHVLGMGKGHIALTLGFETIYLAIAGVGGSILVGMILQGAVTALLCAVMGMGVQFATLPSLAAVGQTALLFSIILLLNLLLDLARLRHQKPTELLREENVGEKEPKARWLLALIGVAALGSGYAIAILTHSAVDALALYFVAVVLVILGTYCLFTAVSIVVLKALKGNKRIYYKTGPFIGLSGMLYRMKRNAVGLANICVLCTMVLVMVSGTLSLYLGVDASLHDMFPQEAAVTVRYDPAAQPELDKAALQETLEAALFDQGYAPKPGVEAEYLSCSFRVLEDGSFVDVAARPEKFYATAYFTFLDYDSYEHLVGRGSVPHDGLAHVYTTGSLPDAATLTLALGSEGEHWGLTLGTPLTKAPRLTTALMYVSDFDYTVALPRETLLELLTARPHGEYQDWSLTWKSFWDLGGEAAGHQQALDNAMDTLIAADMGSYTSLGLESRAHYGADYYSLNGGFFFLGVFLGLLFLGASVLIIYYKQIVEGYEDRTRYHIMRSVGMDDDTIRRSINSQVLVVFFAPLLVAAVHVAFDFPLVARLLTLFGIHQVWLEVLCTLGVFGLFTLLYVGVYRLTARAYYRIVG